MSDERREPHEGSSDTSADTTPAPNPGDAHIRALLADLGSGPDREPMPPHVAARLDETLARLVAERDRTGADPAHDDSGGVVPLRRRWLPRVAAAVAAVVVLVLGGLTVADLGLLDSGSPSSDKASSGTARSSEATDGHSLPRVGSSTFAEDAAAVIGARPTLVPPRRPAAGGRAPSPAPFADERSRACPGPHLAGRVTTITVRYDGRRAALVLHPERHGRVLVEAWSCPGDHRLAAARVRP